MNEFLNTHGEAVLTFLITSVIAAIKRHHDKKVMRLKSDGKRK